MNYLFAIRFDLGNGAYLVKNATVPAADAGGAWAQVSAAIGSVTTLATPPSAITSITLQGPI